MKLDCRSTATLLIQKADGDLTTDREEWLEDHLAACVACRGASERFVRMDREFVQYGELVGPVSSPPERARRPLFHWIPAAASAMAATVLLGLALVHQAPPRIETLPALDSHRFVPIPYVPPLDPYEEARVVRMEVPVAALLAAGYKAPEADSATTVRADVLVGEDGRAHAVRLLGAANLN